MCLTFFFSLIYPSILEEGAISSVGRASRLHREGREFESLIAHQFFRGCSSAWLERLPVTQEAAGSSPVTPAKL